MEIKIIQGNTVVAKRTFTRHYMSSQISHQDIYEKHDAIFVGIGAQTGKTLRIEGADAGNVVSAVRYSGSDWKWKSS